jgi:folate-dependent phosphoribosylglycinamide formyltransferase PurN
VIGVLASGNGSNLQALIDEGLPIVAVASNRPDAYALERAATAGIATATFASSDYETACSGSCSPATCICSASRSSSVSRSA